MDCSEEAVRKSANVEKWRCNVARTAVGARVNPVRKDYGDALRVETPRVQRRRQSLQPAIHTATAQHMFSSQEQAAIRVALALVQGKWKIGVLSRLQEGPARLGDLRRLFPQASKKMLTQHLREMEQDGLIVRTDMSGKVPHVEYTLSEPCGRAVSRLLDCLARWGTEYLSRDVPDLRKTPSAESLPANAPASTPPAGRVTRRNI